MLTSFYFDQELFDDPSLKTTPIISSTILDYWLNYGCLVVSNQKLKNIRDAISSSNIKYQQKWNTALASQSYKKNVISFNCPNLSDFNGMPDFEKFLHPHKVLTGVLTSGYEEIFVPDNCRINNDLLEIVTPSNINESSNFVNSKSLCSQDIRANENIDDIWNTKFSRLAENTKNITIIDRYFALNLQMDLVSGKETALEYLTKKLASNNKPYTIDIFSACEVKDRNNNTNEIESYLDNKLKKKPFYKAFIKINFYLCKDKFFKTDAHDRMICMDEHVIQIGKGMDIFRKKKIENNTFTIKSKIQSCFTDAYRELNRNRAWSYYIPLTIEDA